MKRLGSHTLAVALALGFAAVAITSQPAQAGTNNAAKKKAYIEAPPATMSIMLLAPAPEVQYTKLISLKATAARAIVIQATPQTKNIGPSPALIDTEQIAGVDGTTFALTAKSSYTTRHAAARLDNWFYGRQHADSTNSAEAQPTLTRHAVTTLVPAQPMEAGGNATAIQSATMSDMQLKGDATVVHTAFDGS